MAKSFNWIREKIGLPPLPVNVVLTNKENTFDSSHTQIFTKRGAAVVFDNSGAIFIEFKENGVRYGYVGRSSSSSKDFSIQTAGDIILAPEGNTDANQKRICNLATPIMGGDATTKDYVDRQFENIEAHWDGQFLKTTTTPAITIMPERFINISRNSLSRVFTVNNVGDALRVYETNSAGATLPLTTPINFWVRLIKG